MGRLKKFREGISGRTGKIKKRKLMAAGALLAAIICLAGLFARSVFSSKKKASDTLAQSYEVSKIGRASCRERV